MDDANGGSPDTSADGPEGLGADVEIDRGDVGVVVVEEVEDFGAEFDVAPFADREAFVGREVGVEQVLEADGVGPGSGAEAAEEEVLPGGQVGEDGEGVGVGSGWGCRTGRRLCWTRRGITRGR